MPGTFFYINRDSRNSYFWGSCLVVGCMLLPGSVWSADHPAHHLMTQPRHGAESRIGKSLEALPVSFVENQGQWATPVRFAARTKTLLAFLQKHAVTLQVDEPDGAGGVTSLGARMVFEGASESVTLAGEQRQLGVHNFYVGKDPAKWKTDVPGYGRVTYKGLYEGVDLSVRQTAGSLEYDVLLSEGSDLGQVIIRCDGIQRLELSSDGALIMLTELGPITQQPPNTWYETADGGRRAVASRFRVIDRYRYGFEVPERDHSLPLVIDPEITWSTYLGGSQHDGVNGMCVDASGAIIVAGATRSIRFPSTFPAARTTNRDYDWFVTAVSPDGTTLLWSTVLGGSGPDGANDCDVDDLGRVTVGGITSSDNFPVTPDAVQTEYRPICDGAVVCLDASNGNLEYSTYHGGFGCDWVSRLDVAGSGEAFLFGHTESEDFPVTPNAYDITYGGQGDLFITHLNATGTVLEYSSYLGAAFVECFPYTPPGWEGSMFELYYGQDLALHESTGEVILGGFIQGDFEQQITPGAFQEDFGGGNSDGFVVRMSADGDSLLYATYLGGEREESVVYVDVDASGRAIIGGWTTSDSFPTTSGAFSESHSGDWDGFVTILDTHGGGDKDLVYSTFIGGSSYEDVAAVLVTDSGDIIGNSWTHSDDYPVTPGALDESHNGSGDVALFLLSPDGNGPDDLLYSTFIGGPGQDWASTMDLDPSDGAVLLAGICQDGFPVTEGAYDTTHGGGWDAYVLRFDGLLDGVRTLAGGASGAPVTRLMGVSPNPTAGRLVYTLDLPEEARVRAAIYDVTGRRVQTLKDEFLPAGLHDVSAEIERSRSELANGTYYLRIEVGASQFVREFVLVR